MYLFMVCFILLAVLVINNIAKIIGGGYSDKYLSLNTTQSERGLAAILIILHHLSHRIQLPGIFVIMGYIGFIMVAVFFFLSGYGLMYGLEHKRGYMKGFLKKKLLAIFGPYWIVNTATILLHIIQGARYSLEDYVLSYCGFDVITGTWFISAILIMYVAFYIAFGIIGKKNRNLGYVVLFCIMVVYCVVCAIAERPSSCTASVFAFFYGAMWIRFDVSWKEWIRKQYWIKAGALVLLFGMLFAGRLVLAVKGIDNELLHFLLRNASSIAFLSLIMALLQKIEIKEGKLCQLGAYSLEMYMVHVILLDILRKEIKNDNFYVLSVLLLTAVGCIALKKMWRTINSAIVNRRRLNDNIL